MSTAASNRSLSSTSRCLSPGAARNTFGLNHAVSFLIETRGVGIGRDSYQRRVATHYLAAKAVLETAAVLGARYLNVICADPDTGRFTDRLAELVQMARPYRVRPVIEFMAWRPLRTLAGAVAIATGSGGAGLLLDTLHIQRCGATTEEIAAVDPALLGYLQLCDAPARPPGEDAVTEARTMRLLPGEGELPLGEVLGVLPKDLPVAVEAPSLAARRDLSPAEFARRARRALKAVAG